MSQHWICDTCGEKIKSSEDGWVEWIRVKDYPEKTNHGMRIVHRKIVSPLKTAIGCYYNENKLFARDGSSIENMALKKFLGNNGLMLLLSFLSEDELPKNEIIEIIKRLFIPGYEIARHHFAHAIAEGVFEPNMPKDFYLMCDIEATLKFIEKEDK